MRAAFLLGSLLFIACSPLASLAEDGAAAAAAPEEKKPEPPAFLNAGLGDGEWVLYQVSGLNPDEPSEEFEVKLSNLGPAAGKGAEKSDLVTVEARITPIKKEKKESDSVMIFKADVPRDKVRITENPFSGAKELILQPGKDGAVKLNERQIENRKQNPNGKLFPLITQKNTLPLFLDQGEYKKVGEDEVSLPDGRKVPCEILVGKPRKAGDPGESKVVFERLEVRQSKAAPVRILTAVGKGTVESGGVKKEFAGQVLMKDFGKDARTEITGHVMPVHDPGTKVKQPLQPDDFSDFHDLIPDSLLPAPKPAPPP